MTAFLVRSSTIADGWQRNLVQWPSRRLHRADYGEQHGDGAAELPPFYGT